MKMFIWNNPYKINYGGSVCYAVANTVDEARVLAKDGALRKFGLGAEPAPKLELGEPDYVVECPCAEWYEWYE